MSGFDPGVGNERTALAWQRTALSVMAGSALLTRLNFDRLGVVSLAGLVIALPLAGWVFLESRGRYAHDVGVRLRRRSRGGRAPAALTIATAVLALTQLAAMTLPGLRP